MNPRTTSAICVTLLGLLLPLMFGCQHTSSEFGEFGEPQPTDGKPSALVAPADATRLVEGDVVKIAFEGDTNMNTVVKVQLNGAVTLPLTGELKAAGKSLKELEAAIAEAYKSYLKINEVTVTMINTAAGVYVSGAVLRPGRVALDRPLTALDAIMEAGGFDPNRAKSSGVTVLRMENGQRKHYKLDLKKALRGDDPVPFYVKPFDIVHVPEKTFNF
jgi:polysaccharide export outer membrane protein